MSMIQELKRPWSDFPRVLALYALAGVVGAGTLTFLHVKYPDVSTTSPISNPNTPSVTPEVLPESLSNSLISALPVGNKWTLKEASVWNEIVSQKEKNSDNVVQKTFESKTFDSPSLADVKLNDENFLSSVYSLPIVNKQGKIVGILDSDQLQTIEHDKDAKYIFAHSSDTSIAGNLTESTSTFFPREYLLQMKVVAYKFPEVPDKEFKLPVDKSWYFLLDTSK